MDSLYHTHVKLLAFDFITLTPNPSDPLSFSRKGLSISRAETLGIVTCQKRKPNKFLKFTVDDGTGCILCILWLNQLSSQYFSRRNPSDVRLIANATAEVQLGVVARVRGRITAYRGAVPITVSDVVVERDPNIETLH